MGAHAGRYIRRLAEDWSQPKIIGGQTEQGKIDISGLANGTPSSERVILCTRGRGSDTILSKARSSENLDISACSVVHLHLRHV